ncbi:MAG: L-seryl-tRNA(Sec) selenium transferase, partial [Dehalococcoidia bacterium]
RARRAIGSGAPCPSLEAVVDAVYRRAGELWRPKPLHVVNATGVIAHTNLGRVPLSVEASRAVREAAEGYTDLELDLDTGERGSRGATVETLICQLTGAQAAVAVNNNASAVLLALNCVARGREVVVSRGEAVEIGGGFRIPDVMKESGARLVEVGTTNRTYLSDYEKAITENTAALLRVHTSNFKIVGFVEAPAIEELVELGRRRDVLVLHDLGSGCLLDTSQFGLSPEPMPQISIAAGVDLVFFSGDKLLGGPQAGIIAGKKELVAQIRGHPLVRAVRMDKLTLAALSATLIHYVKEEALTKVPVWRMIATPIEEIEVRARSWLSEIGEAGKVIDGHSTIGGGSLPEETLPTKLLAISPSGNQGVDGIARRLRLGDPPVMGRIDEDLLLLDPRTVLLEEDEGLIGALQRALKEEAP